MIGPFATGKRLNYSQQLTLEDIQGTGELEMLRPGGIWAARSENRVEVFEARLQPARLMQYNELLVPHIAGQVSLDLFHDQGKESHIGLESSRCFRFREERTFNGRLRVESRSSATDGHGNFIHTMGGISLFKSDWPRRTQVRGRVTVPESGTLTGVDIQLHPSGQELPFTVRTTDAEVTLPVEVTKGDVLEIHVTEVPGHEAASLVRAALTVT